MLFSAGQIKSMKSGTGGPHTDIQVHRVQRRHDAQGIAADIPIDHTFIFRQRVKNPPVRTSRAHNRRATGNGIVQGQGRFRLPPQASGHHALGKLIHQGNFLLPSDRHTNLTTVVFNDRFQFLHHQHLAHLRGKVSDLLYRHGPGQPQLQYTGLLTKDLPNILIAGRRSNDAQRGILPHFQTV